LRNFSCITKGDVICVPYNSKNYHMEIKEVKPQDAACIIETDCNVDFDAPLGYKEPTASAPSSGNASQSSALANLKKQSAFAAPEHRSSACPSPTPSSLSAGSRKTDGDGGGAASAGGMKIVDGQIIRPDEESNASTVRSTRIPDRDHGSSAQFGNWSAIPRNRLLGIKCRRWRASRWQGAHSLKG
jgi:ubiquitin fusion degradation protein 1